MEIHGGVLMWAHHSGPCMQREHGRHHGSQVGSLLMWTMHGRSGIPVVLRHRPKACQSVDRLCLLGPHELSSQPPVNPFEEGVNHQWTARVLPDGKVEECPLFGIDVLLWVLVFGLFVVRLLRAEVALRPIAL